ncbi:RraA family protein [Halosimplex salinum]|uniref:RraA family protein n=1 Tax=Halosimplex salinum TaxID=1710538 RepID=UPI000F46BDD6|nr:dimethylmenaquinone methyltransferase [Halosimplex salinum]
MADRPLSADERAELLESYEGLRVPDVTDGMDFLGFHDVNRLDSDVEPLHRDYEAFSHRFVGFANTIRFLPARRPRDLPAQDERTFETTTAWRDEWYEEISGEPEDVREGDVIVVESHEMDVGIVGSANSLHWHGEGAVGVVTNGGPRDTDEIVKQGTPVYAKDRNKTIIPGRAELDDTHVPVNVGGAQIRTDDVIVADGDGVVVVPREVAHEVAEAARREQADDQEFRRELYEKAGLEPDFTLEQDE